MHIQISGKQMDLGDALRERIEIGLEGAVSKYFERTGDANVFVSQEGYEVTVNCNVHLPSGIVLQSSGRGNDPYVALEKSLDKIEKRVRRYKRKLKDHHRDGRAPLPAELGIESVFESRPLEVETEAPDSPLTVAETNVNIRTMSVSEAVMQLEIGESPAILFRNAGHDGLNMVYRRPDGHIGWVNPDPKT